MFDRERVKLFKNAYLPGDRVELVRMNDSQAPPPHTKGTIKGVDDIGNVLVKWDNGSSLNLIPGKDIFIIIK